MGDRVTGTGGRVAPEQVAGSPERVAGSPEWVAGSPEQVAGSRRNRRPGHAGTGGRVTPEYAQNENSLFEHDVQRRMRIAAKDPEAKAKLDQEAAAYRKTFQIESGRLQEEISRLSAAQKDYQHKLNMLMQQAEAAERDLVAAESPTIQQAEADMRALLDSVGNLERDIEKDNQIVQQLREVTKADFESKQKEFDESATFHRIQARNMLYVIGLITVLSVGTIVFLFIVFPTFWKSEGDGIERAISIGLGRIAVLFFFAWALKYVADLHRSHAEQSVIYRDRKAALGVAQNMLNASPDLQHQQELLRTLAIGYLDFQHNAFRSRGAVSAGDSDIKHLKDVVDTVRPLVDSLKDIVGKPKS
jgi:hypothetical protein